MLKFFLIRLVLLLSVVPVSASAAALDDYYLSRFGEQGGAARALVQNSTATVPHADRCRTPLYHSLRKDWQQLQPATQTVLGKRLLKPTLPASYPSPGGHFTIHYATSGANAPALTDVSPANGIPDWVDNVAAVFDHVYTEEVTRMGYRTPPGNRYDIYILDMTREWAYGITQVDTMPAYPLTSSVSYIEVDKAYTDSMFTLGTYQPQQMLEVTAAHEFHHAIQYGMNYYFQMWYGELTATWMEDEVYDTINQLYGYLQDYLPQASTLALNADIDGSSEYGRWIFNRHLAESHSTTFLRDLWGKLATLPAPASGEDIAMLPVIDGVLKDGGQSLSQEFLQFAKRLYKRNWNTQHASEIDQIPEVTMLGSQSSYPVDVTAINARIAALPAYTIGYYRFLPSGTAPATLVLSLASVPTAVDVVAIKKNTDGSFSEYPLDRSTGTVTVQDFNAPSTAEVVLVITNSSSASSPATPGGATFVPSSSKGGGCFIATAAYGSYLHPKVALLREFRDRHLLTNAPGRLLVALYYRVSPPIARVIAGHAWMRGAVRVLLTPVVLSVEHPLVAALLFIGCCVMGGRRIARRRRMTHSLSVA